MTAVTDDPTMDLLRSLDEPGRFVIRNNIPVIMPSRRIRKRDGKVTEIVITEADLPNYLAATQALESEDGIVLRLTLGHTKPGAAAKDQPPFVGYARLRSVSRFGPKMKPCIRATHYFKPECYEEAKEYPYRSPEFYPERDEIRGIALLKVDPELDMGMVAYESDVTSDQPDDDTPDGHDEWTKHFEHYAKRSKWVGYAMQCYEGQSPMATGPSTATAANVSEPKMPTPAEEAAKGEAVRMEREQHAIQYAKVQSDLAAVVEDNKQLRERLVRIERERDEKDCEARVIQLEAEHYQLDRADEVEALLKLDKPGRDKHCERIRKRYQKAPVPYNKEPIPIYGGHVESEDRPAALTAAQVAECVRYAKGDDEKYTDAIASMKKTGKLPA